MRILLSNDDGIEADGLKCLERVARSFSDDVWVVAPERDQSGASHSLSLMNPVRYRGLAQRKFAVEGTPTDCILLGVRHLIPPPKPDLVLTGINCGGNLGDDVTYSGTVAGAVEGTLHGIPSIALSLVWGGEVKSGTDLINALVYGIIGFFIRSAVADSSTN